MKIATRLIGDDKVNLLLGVFDKLSEAAGAAGEIGSWIHDNLSGTLTDVTAAMKEVWDAVKGSWTDMIPGFISTAIASLIAKFVPGVGWLKSIYDIANVIIQKYEDVKGFVVALQETFKTIVNAGKPGNGDLISTIGGQVFGILKDTMQLAFDGLMIFLNLDKVGKKLQKAISDIREKIENAIVRLLEPFAQPLLDQIAAIGKHWGGKKTIGDVVPLVEGHELLVVDENSAAVPMIGSTPIELSKQLECWAKNHPEHDKKIKEAQTLESFVREWGTKVKLRAQKKAVPEDRQAAADEVKKYKDYRSQLGEAVKALIPTCAIIQKGESNRRELEKWQKSVQPCFRQASNEDDRAYEERVCGSRQYTIVGNGKDKCIDTIDGVNAVDCKFVRKPRRSPRAGTAPPFLYGGDSEDMADIKDIISDPCNPLTTIVIRTNTVESQLYWESVLRPLSVKYKIEAIA